MEMSEKIRYLRKQYGLTLEEVGNKVGVGKSTVRKWESGEIANMRRDKIAKLAEALNTTPAYLMGWEEAEPPVPANLHPVKLRKVPVLGGIAAGEPIYAQQEYDEYTDVDNDVVCDYALRVEGDSMEPTICLGDLVFIRKQPDVNDGQVAAVLIDDSATLKRIFHLPGGLTLVSDNAAKFPPRTLTTADGSIRILGRAVYLKRRI